jgi:hypothetical protein
MNVLTFGSIAVVNSRVFSWAIPILLFLTTPAFAAGTLSGTVVDANDGTTPVHPVWIWLWDHVTKAPVEGSGVNNNPDGSYIMENIPEGSYKVFYDTYGSAGAYTDMLYDNVKCEEGCSFHDDGDVLIVTTGQYEANVQMERRLELSGQVTNNAGLPIAGVSMEVFNSAGTQISRSSGTTAEGNWFEGVPGPGTFYVRIAADTVPGYHPEIWNDTPCDGCDAVATGTPITVDSLDVGSIDFQLQPIIPIDPVESPFQANFPYFEDDRGASTPALNGRVFNSGFSLSVWFNFRKLLPELRGILGDGPSTMNIESPGNGDLHVTYNLETVNIPAVEMDQWINLAVTAGDGQVRFYKNGELVSESAMSDTTITFPEIEENAFYLGYFWGYAKQLKIWDTVLSQAELQAEIAVASSVSKVPIHQWLMNDGVGSQLRNTGNVGGETFNYTNQVIWKNVNSPYEILLESEIKIHSKNKTLPGTAVWGSADFNQDGVKEVFLHGGSDDYYPEYQIPMLILQIDDNERLTDASETLVDGGLYYHRFPTGRETVIADLNNDGFNDVFAATGSGHIGAITPEHSLLLLSDVDGKRMLPSEHRIMSPPCTLSAPMYEGQKPCQTSDSGGIVYPDEGAPLVPMSKLDYGHATSSGDIDRDGDIDLYVQTVYGGERNDLPVCPYFLINDGAGNFTANWQLVPHKALKYNSETFDSGPAVGMLKDQYYNFGKLSDFDQDGFLDLALIIRWSEAAELLPPEGPFDVETDNPWQSLYELIAWGDESGFSEEYTILTTKHLPTTAYRGTDTEPFAVDFDNDGDEDLIINRVNDSGWPGSWLQIFRNNGGRVFEDVTDDYLPQTLADINSRPRSVSLEPYDLNQDGCIDFIATQEFPVQDLNGLPPFRIWLNDCNGRFSPVRDSLFGKVGMMIPLDLDGDGGLDFVSINRNNDGDGKLYEATILRQVAPIDVSYFGELIFGNGFE